MIWRILALFGALSCGCYVYRTSGENAASAVFSGLSALLLVLSEIERRLSEILKELSK